MKKYAIVPLTFIHANVFLQFSKYLQLVFYLDAAAKHCTHLDISNI